MFNVAVASSSWLKREEIEALFALPMNDLLFKAHSIHREVYDPNEVQISRLLSIKTGAALRIVNTPAERPLCDTGLGERAFAGNGNCADRSSQR